MQRKRFYTFGLVATATLMLIIYIGCEYWYAEAVRRLSDAAPSPYHISRWMFDSHQHAGDTEDDFIDAEVCGIQIWQWLNM